MENGLFATKNSEVNIGYYLFLPDNYDKTKQYPMIVFLHGAGERGNGTDELHKITKHGLCKYASQGEKFDSILLCPQCPSRSVWDNIVCELKALIDKIAADCNADPHRISITGISMGGYGTWAMGLNYPYFFSAIAPVCGGGMSWRSVNLKKMPIWAFHGDADAAVPVERSLEMVDAVNKNGGIARLTIFHGVGHNSWDNAYLETRVIDWLTSQYREDFSKQKEAYDE